MRPLGCVVGLRPANMNARVEIATAQVDISEQDMILYSLLSICKKYVMTLHLTYQKRDQFVFRLDIPLFAHLFLFKGLGRLDDQLLFPTNNGHISFEMYIEKL